MRVTFSGVGEAFDETLPNTSVLVETGQTSALLDCGFTAASAFWKAAQRPIEVDALYISHFHGDHYFGIPALFVRSVQERRTKPLNILGQPGVEERVRHLIDMAYPNTRKKAQFDLIFTECTPDIHATVGDISFSFAWSDHPLECLSVRVESGGKSVFYSGDGRPTNETAILAAGCDLVVHEAFSLEPDNPGHGTVGSAIEFATKAQARMLAMVHVDRMVRRKQRQKIEAMADSSSGPQAFLPEPGDNVNL